jgi:EAL domain-containing protein (putative c-di-GMP-specific phosphodiesterase class I)
VPIAIGEISPGRFVPLAEHVSLSAEFSRWSLNAGVRDAQRVLASGAQRVHVNVSPRAFDALGLAAQVRAALEIWALNPDRLVLEVTESAVLDDPVRAAKVLNELRTMGVGVAIDDFGKGYSSFGYLRDLPATELKIDQIYARNLTTDSRAQALVRSMAALGHALGLAVTLEGIEDEATAQLAHGLGCACGQGFALGRPMPP